MKKTIQLLSEVFTLLLSNLFCVALFGAIRTQDADYTMIGLPLFIVTSAIHLMVSKKWKAYLLTSSLSAVFGLVFPFVFS